MYNKKTLLLKKSMTYVFGHDGVTEIEFIHLPQITKTLDGKEENQVFQTTVNTQHSIMIHGKRETNKMTTQSALVFCLKAHFRPQDREGKPKWNTDSYVAASTEV